MTVDNEINGSLLKIKRESLGWTLADMAARACLSTKQVRQLEEGGDNSFYSHAIKLTVAKKIAQILQISEDELFNRAPLVSPATEFDAPTHEVSIEHLDHSDSPSLALSQNLLKINESESNASAQVPSATRKDTEQAVSFASILTRSQSSSDDLDELLAEEESSPTLIANADSTEQSSGAVSQAISQISSTTSVSETAPEVVHSETVGVPSSPSPITLSSASSSLSEDDQNNNEQSIWGKVILVILVLVGALLIVAPKSFEGLADWVEGRFKKTETSSEATSNGNATPTAIPALDASQNDTPVELAKPSINAQDGTKPAPPSMPTPVVTPSVPLTAPAPAQQSSNATIPTTAVPSANPSLGTGALSSPKQQNPTAVTTPQPVAPTSNGQ